MARREIQVFNMSFLDMMTNFLGAVIILFLLAAQNVSKLPAGSATKLKVEASLDPDRLIIHGRSIDAKVGDTLLFVITDNERLSCKQEIVGYDKRDRYERPHVDTTGLTEAKKRQPEAIFITQIDASTCNNNNTPTVVEDDTYTIALQVEKTGKPGSRCTIDGNTYLYKNDIVIGPFFIKDGPKTISVRDELNGALTKTQVVNPPKPCSQKPEIAGNPNPDNSNNKGQPNLPGAINFYAEWDDPNDYVNIYVKKESSFVFGGHPKDANIGEFVEFSGKGGFFNRKNTNVEAVRQLQKHIPGTYQVYLHYRGNKEDAKTKSEVPVKVWLLNKAFPSESQPFSVRLRQTDKNPRRGGGLLVVTVEITQDGHFKIRR